MRRSLPGNKTKRESRAADTAVGVAGVSLREQARALDEDHDIVIGLLDKLEAGDRRPGIQVEPAATGDGRKTA